MHLPLLLFNQLSILKDINVGPIKWRCGELHKRNSSNLLGIILIFDLPSP
jgi:hypothetical protein